MVLQGSVVELHVGGADPGTGTTGFINVSEARQLKIAETSDKARQDGKEEVEGEAEEEEEKEGLGDGEVDKEEDRGKEKNEDREKELEYGCEEQNQEKKEKDWSEEDEGG
ncbi:acidic leucine-rich nuclear phosphoprotein 32 family member A-like [Eurytemora carolleeae]|uniref:acidic leucine-rich nuclear phosphoprotein 32 family member A-like n=1 Tax=Eurytemora carolleeae TaxID=1294199 RepID=UPI000C76C161|nr:acidic leucine-rich nuclear phosphoprotein 32 family member A-like [Eurytemora carolleeae]|eukprot:XP_023324684.1 acidic leucine-rich nuclear phosphoprotein 32 family member A-like [Eurytemora affinis]